MTELEKLIAELKDNGVSGDYSERFVTRAELAEALELLSAQPLNKEMEE